MTPERWQRVKDIFDQADGLEPGDRPAFLDEACAEDSELRAEVESLLGFSPAAVFETPVAKILEELLPSAIEPGRRFGAYRVERELGRGGMAVVYAAVRDDDQYQQQVAIKLIKRGMDTDAIVARFRQERQILANLEHPNIARLLDGGVTEDGLPYLVMEHIEGEPIDVFCQRRQLPLAQRLELLRTVCAAIHSAHQKLVVHRDLKPSNLLVTADGLPKLLDFGIAKLVTPEPAPDSALPTAAGLRPMTPEVASPEQVRGEPLTTASDVYALGVLLYQLLTDQRPYRLSRLTPAEIERVVCDQEPERPSVAVRRSQEAGEARRWHRRLAGDLDTIVAKAMHKAPERRYGSAEQLSEDLRRYLEGLPVIARPDTLAYRASKFITRNRWGVAAAALIFISLLAGIIATTWQAREASNQRLAAEWVADYLVDLFAVSHPGRSRGVEITARELLDQGAERLSRRLESLPESTWGPQRLQVQARLMDAIGLAYFRLGVYDQASERLDEALRIRRQTGAEDLALADSLDHLGELHRAQARFQEAEQSHREALALRRGQLGEQDVSVAESRRNLGMALYYQDRLDEAENQLRQALAIEQQVVGTLHPETAMTLNNLALVLMDQGQIPESEALYRQALAIHRESVDGDRPEVEIAVILNNLASLLQNAGDCEQALGLYEETLAIELKLLGERHPDLAITQNNMALCLRDLGRHEAAESLYRASLELRREALGAAHPDVAGSLNNLGQLLSERGDLEAAEERLLEALAIYRQLSARHRDQATTLSNLAALQVHRRDFAAAEDSRRQALDLRLELLGDRHPDVASARQSLAELLRRTGQLEEAVTQFRSAWQLRREILGENHEQAARSHYGLALATSASGSCERAEPILREGLDLWQQQPAEVGRGRVAVLRSLLGGCLTDLGQYAEAEPLLLASYEVRPDPRTRRRLAELYEAWGRPEAAAPYRSP